MAPRLRTFCTQPASVTVWPTFAARSAPHVWVLYIIICIYCSVWLSLYLQLQDTKVRNLYEKRQCRQNFIGNHIPFYTAAPPKPDYRSGPRPKSPPRRGGENLQTRLCHEHSDSRPGAAARNPAGCKSYIATILQHRAAAARPCREREDYERIDQRQRSTAAAR